MTRCEAGIRGWPAFLGATGGAQDVFGGDVPVLARQFIAAMGPTDPFQDAVAHRRLQDRLEVTGWQLWRAAKVFDAGRLRALIAMSITAATARMLLRETSGMDGTRATVFLAVLSYSRAGT